VGVEWIRLAYGKDNSQALVNTVMNLPELLVRVNECCLTKMAAPPEEAVCVTVMNNCHPHQHGITRVEHLSTTS